MDERTTTLKAILRTDELPTLPDVVHQILAITGDPLSSMRELTDVIERDPSLSANLLRMVNSAYFGLSRKIYAIHNAKHCGDMLHRNRGLKKVLCLMGSLWLIVA